MLAGTTSVKCPVSADRSCRLLRPLANAGGSTWSAGSNPALSSMIVASAAQVCGECLGNYRSPVRIRIARQCGSSAGRAQFPETIVAAGSRRKVIRRRNV